MNSKLKNNDQNQEFNPGLFEKKWQDAWEEKKVFSPDMDKAQNPFYNLMMFPYPSAEGLHVGNMYAFTGADVYARFNRMQGKDVFEPIGLDGFGIHSENYALKVGRHPKEQAEISEKNYYRQLRAIGNSFDWKRTIETYDPDYYRWTQWLFVQMFKKGLAYRQTATVNWCPSDMTVLSDEQVIDGKCERCSSIVEKRDLEQWFFRITKYAQRLLDNIEKLNWTEKVKIAQRNWIGRSEGAVIDFKVIDLDCQIKVFTTRPDTLYGATFVVLSPEHPIAQKINEKTVKEYIKTAQNKSDTERLTEGKEKTGVFSGRYAVNPVNNEKIPIWIADYVLMGYGTGAIMAVPAHDGRDFEFAKKYKLPIKRVIHEDGAPLALDKAYEGSGYLVNSDEWNNWNVPESIIKVVDWIEKKGLGKREVNYHLRDWLISRQRYWGPPIPMIYCEKCAKEGKSWFNSSESSENQKVRQSDAQKVRKSESSEFSGMAGWYPVPENQLPVLLPDVKDWKPMGTGKAPLANHPEFYNVACPGCGAEATRETDVSDTFLDSAWYFFRYTSVDIESVAFDVDRVKKWFPVDIYIGGAEHSVLHLLYSRFVTMVLADLKMVDFEEPYPNFFAHGLIIKDGAKMSKSKGNVVVPDIYIAKYGADTLRAYLMFLGPFSQGGDFRDSGIEGMYKFLRRVWKLLSENSETQKIRKSDLSDNLKHRLSEASEFSERLRMMHRTIKRVTDDLGSFSYNTAISALMEWYNFLFGESVKGEGISSQEIEIYLKLLAPFAPHMTEELWQRQGEGNMGKGTGFESIHTSSWPELDEKYLVADEVIVVVQVNGKRRGEINISSSEIKNQEKIEAEAKSLASKYLEGEKIKKVIYVPGKIINFVV